jgi:tRNA A-37 threonylcarbamoyl transferase component Bud32
LSGERTLGDGRYRLEALLGKGGMAEVHRVLDTNLGVYRAIKVLNADLARNKRIRERFENEAHAMAKLAHPNIVTVYEIHAEEGSLYFVMELADGGSLGERIRQKGPMSPRDVCDTVMAVLPALDAAHKERIVHRDIKPENLLVDRYGTIKLSDFGIARVADRSPTLTRTGAVMGTWAYMAPEQRENSKAVDGRADLYALGCTILLLVTGREPFDLHNPESHERVFTGIPEALAEVIKRATRYKADDRFSDAGEMLAAVRAIRDAMPTESLELLLNAPTMYQEEEDHPEIAKDEITDGDVVSGTIAPETAGDTHAPEAYGATNPPEERRSGVRRFAPIGLMAGGALLLALVWRAMDGANVAPGVEPAAVSAGGSEGAETVEVPRPDPLPAAEVIPPPPVEPTGAVEPVAQPVVKPEPVAVKPTTTKKKPTPTATSVAAPTVAAVPTGKLRVSSNMGAAVEVFIEGAKKGTARSTFDLDAKQTVVTLVWNGVSVDRPVEIKAGETTALCWNFGEQQGACK